MSRWMLVLALSVPLAVLAAPSRAHAWGATTPPSFSQFDPPGVYRSGVSSYGNNNNPYAGAQRGNVDTFDNIGVPRYGYGGPSYFGGYGTVGGFGYGGIGYGGIGPGLYRRW